MTALRLALPALVLAAALTGPSPTHAQSKDDPAFATTSSLTRVHFLADAPLPDGTMLLLTLLATGGYGDGDAPIFRVVRDTAALRAAAPLAWVADDPGAARRGQVLSTVFQSPPAAGFGDEFALLVYPDGTTRSTHVFHPAMQDGYSPPPHDLAGLLALSDPVYERTEAVTDTAAYSALIARIDREPDLFTLLPLPPTAPELAYPTVSDLVFPSLLLPTDDVTDARIAAEVARANARFTALFGAPGETYAPFLIHGYSCDAPMITDNAGVPVLVNGQPLILPGFTAIAMTTELFSDGALITRITDATATFDPENRIDPGLDAAFATLLAEKLGPADPADYRLDITCWSPDLTAYWPRQNETHVSFFEILPDAGP